MKKMTPELGRSPTPPISLAWTTTEVCSPIGPRFRVAHRGERPRDQLFARSPLLLPQDDAQHGIVEELINQVLFDADVPREHVRQKAIRKGRLRVKMPNYV